MSRVKHTVLGMALATVLSQSGVAQTGGEYDLSWNVIAGGGTSSATDTSNGLIFKLGNTLGQSLVYGSTPLISGADFTLSIGFWFQRPPGDVNGDGCTNDVDLLRILFAFGDNASNAPNEDLNEDGIIDDADLLILLFDFGAGCG